MQTSYDIDPYVCYTNQVKHLIFLSLVAAFVVGACDCNESSQNSLDSSSDAFIGDAASDTPDGTTSDTAQEDAAPKDAPTSDVLPDAERFSELWYPILNANFLVHVQLSAVDGSLDSKEAFPTNRGASMLTLTRKGQFLAARNFPAAGGAAQRTELFYLPERPAPGTAMVEYQTVGTLDGILLEGLYTDCEDRLYGMDSGTDNTNAIGNRLIRFTGDVFTGDLDFVVVSDLSSADVADIDDLGPGIDDDGNITDNPGFAIDTSSVFDFDYTTGSGTRIGMAGTYGIHVLSRDLFDDDTSRLYVMSLSGALEEVDPVNLTTLRNLGGNPSEVPSNNNGRAFGGLAGPLGTCTTGFVVR